MTTTLVRDDASPLDHYEPGRATLVSSPSGTRLAVGIGAVVPPGEGPNRLAGVGRRAARTLAEAGAQGLPPLVIGALPFHPGVEPHLVVPERLHLGAPLCAWGDDVPAPVFSATPTARPVPGPQEYAARVADAVAMLRAGDGLDKVVLARALELRGGGPTDIAALIRRLAARDPWAHVFAVDLPSADGGRCTLVGASPETLLRRTGDVVESLPLAGSAKRHPDPCEDARRGAALLCSDKARDEHAVVVRAIVDALGPLCSTLEVPSGPELIRTRAMWHLATRIRGRLIDPQATTALDLAGVLHPTPAVCGLPRDRAREAIALLEPRDRGFYAGAVGWQDAAGDGEWIVAIRCAEVHADMTRLWAGAGLVGESDPAGELAETTAKFGTLLSALGVPEGV